MSDANKRPRGGLGRGLNALLGDIARDDAPIDSSRAQSAGVRLIPVSAIAPHPEQPRRHFDEDALNELAASIAERGIIQPIVVRPHGHDYQIVAGERRWRAAKLAGLEKVPALVRERDDAASLELALVENMARADLNPVEEARACAALVEELNLTREEVGRRFGRSRVAVSNLLRLLDLPD